MTKSDWVSPLLFIGTLAAGCESSVNVDLNDVNLAGAGGASGLGGAVATTGGTEIRFDFGGTATGGNGGTDAVCGNGRLEPGELCDDGDTEDDDGCSADCSEQDPDYFCLEPGEDCVKVVNCGSNLIEGDEACDDGNEGSGDGCSADCTEIEDGWICPRPGRPCVVIPVCGDGVMERGELCDDGNATSGDGCSGTEDDGVVACHLEDGFWCPGAGEDCAAVACGDGLRSPDEECDDGDDDAGDGCSDTCTVEGGWICTAPGEGCVPLCGDGLRRGGEECDDGNQSNGDGCSAACRLELHYICPVDGEECVPTECGNQMPEPGEGCDDGNYIAGDGCSPSCQLEPTVTVGSNPVVNTFCGDGMVTGGEECDDGNQDAGDGCSPSCIVEDGYECETIPETPEYVEFAVTYRDFMRKEDPGGHPDFERRIGSLRREMPGPVCTTSDTEPCVVSPGEVCDAGTCGVLDDEGKPVFHLTGTQQEAARVESAQTFALWFRDANVLETEGDDGVIEMCQEQDSLRLHQVTPDSDVYRFDSEAHFPLGERCFGITPRADDNYHFTTELRYFFQYRGGETLTFRGDDDVWVFINGRHAVDIGGVHTARLGRVVLGDDGGGDATDSDCSVHGATELADDCALEAEELADDTDQRFGLTVGGVYEIVLFHAERHTVESNFQLTLAGFLAPRSYCAPICGDGEVVGWEICDDGLANNTGEYGHCDATCMGRTFCGDAIRQGPSDEPPGPESCDDGYNNALYAHTADSCAAGCTLPPYCGDGNVDAAFELCDHGDDNADDAYDGCTTTCTWGPYCGDGVTQSAEGEECDDGADNVLYSANGTGCGPDCKPAPYCGDGIRNGGEECDEGTEGNTGEYGGCNEDCSRGPYCGDGVIDASEGEQCDDGPTGSLHCTPTCRVRDEVH